MASIYTIKIDGIEYRAYFDPKILQTATGDSLLKSYVTPEIIKESSDYIEALALSYGKSKNQIPIPTPYKIQKIALFYAYVLTALYKTQMSVGKDAEEDSFALKYKYYKGLLDQFENSINGDIFTDGVQSKRRAFPMVVPISRN